MNDTSIPSSFINVDNVNKNLSERLGVPEMLKEGKPKGARKPQQRLNISSTIAQGLRGTRLNLAQASLNSTLAHS